MSFPCCECCYEVDSQLNCLQVCECESELLFLCLPSNSLATGPECQRLCWLRLTPPPHYPLRIVLTYLTHTVISHADSFHLAISPHTALHCFSCCFSTAAPHVSIADHQTAWYCLLQAVRLRSQMCHQYSGGGQPMERVGLKLLVEVRHTQRATENSKTASITIHLPHL